MASIVTRIRPAVKPKASIAEPRTRLVIDDLYRRVDESSARMRTLTFSGVIIGGTSYSEFTTQYLVGSPDHVVSIPWGISVMSWYGYASHTVSSRNLVFSSGSLEETRPVEGRSWAISVTTNWDQGEGLLVSFEGQPSKTTNINWQLVVTEKE